MSRVRTIPRESAQPSQQSRSTPSNVAHRPTAVRAVPVDPTMNPTGPAPAAPSGRVHVVAPSRFGDAKEIADRLKDNRPVIVNLQMADRDLQRRMIDFCSGVTYALSGEMEKVADQVFLLAPTNVKVSDEERQRLVERGFGRD
jgi:cell division inhibitor SepF